MYVQQKLSILFYPMNSKQSGDGMVPLYVRVTIDGVEDQISTKCGVHGRTIIPDC